MRNSFKKWFFSLGLALGLLVFFFVWGCFTPSKQRITGDWKLSSEAEEIYEYLVLEQSLRSGDVEEVKRAVKLLIEVNPSEETFVDAISSLMFKAENEMALEFAEKAYMLYPDSSRVILLYAETLMESGKVDKSISLLSIYVKKNPDETQIALRLTELLIELTRYEQANEILELIPIDAMPMLGSSSFFDEEDVPIRQTAFYSYKKGSILARLGKWNEAEIMLKKALEKNPKFIGAWAELAFVYEETERTAEALDIYHTMLDKDRDNPLIWVRAVHAELQMGNVDTAYSMVKIGPPSLSFLLPVAELFMGIREWSKAEQIYLKAATIPGVKDDVFLYLFLAAYDGPKDRVRAMNYLNMISLNSPLFERATLYKVQILAESAQFDDAHAIVDEAIEEYPAQNSLWQSKVTLYHMQGKYDEVERLLDKALKQLPNDSGLMFSKGALYDQLERKAEAMQVMEEIIKHHPDDSAALNYVGYTLAEKGEELDRAYSLITKALEGDPENVHIIDSLAWVQYKLGDYTAAYESILKAIEYSPKEAEIWEHYGDISRAVDKLVQAKEAYIQALKLEPDNPEEIQKKLAELQEI